ncbi:MAG: hypothetical protein H6696_11330 [Deferribacteres bacterium]|nr:hypothetical protein [Deferribacteres bacterium]
MNQIQRLIVWICRRFTRDQILNIVDELVQVLDNKNPELHAKDDFKEKHPNYRDFSVDPLAPLDAAKVIPPKKK